MKECSRRFFFKMVFGLILVVCFFGCSKKPSQSSDAPGSPPKVVLIGLDGADWQIIDKLEREGRLPNLSRMRREGVRATLLSEPPLISPIVWTTLATGRKPLDHGIFGFLTNRKGRLEPVRSDQRRVRAFWNIASDFNVPVGVVGWYATWPAESVKGYLVSDRLGPHQVERPNPERDGVVFPPVLTAEVWKYREDSRRKVGIERARQFFAQDADLTLLPKEKLDRFVEQLQTTEFNKSLFIDLNRQYKPAIAAVYFEGTDAVGHLFVDYQAPLAPGLDSLLEHQFGPAFSNYYAYIDEVVGELVRDLDPQQTTVLVISDHGFRVGENRPRGKTQTTAGNQAPQWHRPEGIFLAWGRGIVSGKQLKSVHLLDVAPTVLRLAGLPLAQTLPGRPVEEAFSPVVFREPVHVVDDYEGRGPRGKMAAPADSSEGDAQDRIDQLRALGYVGDKIVTMNTQAGGDGQEAIPENVFNRGLLLHHSGRDDEALQEFKRLEREVPSSAEGFFGEGLVLLNHGDLKGAEKALRRAIQLAPELPLPVALLGYSLVRQGEDREAAEMLARSLNMDPGNAHAAAVLGQLLLRHRQFTQAKQFLDVAVEQGSGEDQALGWVGLAALAEDRRDFSLAFKNYSRALAAETDFPPALERAGNLCLAIGQNKQALDFLERLVRRSPDNAQGQMLWGLALARNGRLPEARSALEKAVRLDPGLTQARELLRELGPR